MNKDKEKEFYKWINNKIFNKYFYIFVLPIIAFIFAYLDKF